jgi:hypothetical protein
VELVIILHERQVANLPYGDLSGKSGGCRCAADADSIIFLGARSPRLTSEMQQRLKKESLLCVRSWLVKVGDFLPCVASAANARSNSRQ